MSIINNKLIALENFLRDKTGAIKVAVNVLGPLDEVTMRKNWAVDLNLDGREIAAVLSAGLPSSSVESWHKEQEFVLLQVAYAAGVKVPQPVWVEPTGSVMGRPFHLTRRLLGIANPAQFIHEVDEEEGNALAYELGEQLAKFHNSADVVSSKELAFLPKPPTDLIGARINELRTRLDALSEPHPVLEWAANRLEDEKENYLSGPEGIRLCHRDFRTGSYVVDQQKLVGLLNFEFAGWSDLYEDLGWFCARCWRFGKYQAEAGGIGTRAAFYSGYKSVGGEPIDDGRVRFWEQMAALRQAILLLEKAERHFSGREQSIELALASLESLEVEYDLLIDLCLPGFKPVPRRTENGGNA